MRVECLNGLLGREPIIIDNPSTVIVRNDNGEIVMVACEHGSGGICVTRPTDKDFERICYALGLKPPTIDFLTLPGPPPGAELLR